MYGKPCPICDERTKLWKENPDEAKKLYPKRQRAFVVDDLMEKEEGLKLFVTPDPEMKPDGFFHYELVETLKDLGSDDVKPFDDVEDGSMITFKSKKEKLGSGGYFIFKNLSFEERKDQYDQDIIDESFQLDKMLHIPTYDEVSASFFGLEDDQEDEDDEDDEPEAKEPTKSNKENTKSKKSNNETVNDCPEGFKFGEDYDDEDECEDCEVRKSCRKAYNEK